MVDFAFSSSIKLFFDSFKRSDGSYFFQNPSSGGSAFQKQHIDPRADMNGGGADFFAQISSQNVDPEYRFNGLDYNLNSAALPASVADSARLGIARHTGSHPAYTNVVAQYRRAEVLRGGPGVAPADEPWLRFDYVADDLNFPLAVKWAPEHGEIIVDYNLSLALGREVTQSVSAPPFGAFLRVDEMAADAFWCWPRVLDSYFIRCAALPRGHEPPLTLYRVGGWRNGEWKPNLVQETHVNYERAQLESFRPSTFPNMLQSQSSLDGDTSRLRRSDAPLANRLNARAFLFLDRTP